MSDRLRLLSATSTARHPHEMDCFTQGLLRLSTGEVLESTGLYGSARLIARGGAGLRSQHVHAFERAVFAEDLCEGPDGVVVLTWREKTALRWNPAARSVEGAFDYDREGWGICFAGSHYLTSDGTSTLVHRDRALRPVREVGVHVLGRPLAGINALHWTERETVLACVYGLDYLVEIDADSGSVTTLIDATSLRDHEGPDADVLSGITFGSRPHSLLVTGKFWSWMHEVELRPADELGRDLDAIVHRMPARIEDIEDISPPGERDA